jgi:phenylalanyl-tRNA synthetase beta chain
LLEAQKGNESYGIYDVALFEVGKIFPELNEQRQVGILISGDLVISDWRGRSLPADFFVLKGMIEELLESLGAQDIRFEAMNQPPDYLHPYRSAEIFIGDDKVGEMGVVHPDVVEAWELRNEPVVAFLRFDVLMKLMDAKRKAKGVVRSPALWRDISMIVSKDMPISRVLETIRSFAGPYLEEVSVFDVFEDAAKIGEGMRSVAVRLIFRKPEGALSSDEADTIMEGIYKALEDMGVKVRR